MIKICCITYKDLDKLVRQAIGEIQDGEIEISIAEGLREKIIEKMKREISAGAEIFIAGGANAEIAEENFKGPIMRYKISDFDYLAAIDRGFELGKKPAIVTYRKGISEKLKEYLDTQKKSICNIVYEDTQDLEEAISREQVDVVIGHAHPVEVGKYLNCRTVSIYPGIRSIIDTIYDAKLMAGEIRKVKEENQYKNTILNYMPSGVLLIDAAERIVDRNAMAKEMLGMAGQHIKNREIGEIIPGWAPESFKESGGKETVRVLQIQNQEMLVRIVKIGENLQEFSGAVLILSKLNEIRKAQMEHSAREQQEKRNRGFQAKKYFKDIIGSSFELKSCMEDAGLFAKSDSAILIHGETGTGKEIFAQSIHNKSNRASGPFIAINCGALTESLLEAELFGYDEGAFTGSRKGGKKGVFELAEGGTIFLDEIGELSPFMQTRLLRVLQEHEVMRVGGERIIPINVRVIAATNRDLEHTKPEIFRRDLLYRLNVLELQIPPLRERGDDRVVLFDFFYKQYRDVQNSRNEIPQEVKNIINRYSWPGNIREMQNVCERFCLYMEEVLKANNPIMKKYIIKAIGEERLQREILQRNQYGEQGISKELVSEIREVFGYSMERIADILKSSRTTIWRMMKEE